MAKNYHLAWRNLFNHFRPRKHSRSLQQGYTVEEPTISIWARADTEAENVTAANPVNTKLVFFIKITPHLKIENQFASTNCHI